MQRSFLTSIFDRILCVICAVSLMQAPLFLATYISTLSGALSEARHFHQELEERAQGLGLNLEAYIAKHLNADERIFRQTGAALSQVQQRYERHLSAYRALSDAPLWQQPWSFAQHYDPQVLRAVHFEPGLSLSWGGLLYGVIGVLLGMSGAAAVRQFCRLLRRARQAKSLPL